VRDRPTASLASHSELRKEELGSMPPPKCCDVPSSALIAKENELFLKGQHN